MLKPILASLSMVLVTVLAASGEQAAITAITGGRALTMAGPAVESATVLVRNGKIESVVANGPIPAGASVIDAGGEYVLPGLIDCHTHASIQGDFVGPDTDETPQLVSPEMRVVDAIYMYSSEFMRAREAGITTVGVFPGGKNLIGGQGAAIKTTGRTVQSALLRAFAGVKLSLGEEPKRDGGSPRTRMGEMAILRKTLREASEFGIREKEGQVLEEMKNRPLVEMMRGTVPGWIQALRAGDISNALGLAREFHFPLVLVYANESWRLVDEIQKANVPVVVTPVKSMWYRWEKETYNPATPARLAAGKVLIAVSAGEGSPYGVAALPIYAAYAMRWGLTEDDALRAITLNPAKILGVDRRVGSLEPGKDADIVTFRGHPLDVRSRVDKVWINGEIVYENR